MCCVGEPPPLGPTCGQSEASACNMPSLWRRGGSFLFSHDWHGMLASRTAAAGNRRNDRDDLLCLPFVYRASAGCEPLHEVCRRPAAAGKKQCRATATNRSQLQQISSGSWAGSGLAFKMLHRCVFFYSAGNIAGIDALKWTGCDRRAERLRQAAKPANFIFPATALTTYCKLTSSSNIWLKHAAIKVTPPYHVSAGALASPA